MSESRPYREGWYSEDTYSTYNPYARNFDEFTFDAETFDALISNNLNQSLWTAIAAGMPLTGAIKAAMKVMGGVTDELIGGGFDSGFSEGFDIGELSGGGDFSDDWSDDFDIGGAATTAIHLPLTVSAATFVRALMNPLVANAVQLALNVDIQVIARVLERCNQFMPARGVISYGDFILNQMPYTVDLLAVYSAASREVVRARRLRGGAVRIGTSYSEKIIAIRGRIVAAGRSKLTMEESLDQLHKALSLPSQNLKIGYTDERFYADTELLEELEVDWSEESRNFLTWNAKILALEPFSKSIETKNEVDTLGLGTVSGNHRTKSIVTRPGGTIYTWPVITITFPAGAPSPYGTTVLWVTNTTVSPTQTIQITKAFGASDTIEIDNDEQTVKVNGVLVDFDGQFIYLDPRLGNNSIEVHTTSTASPSSLPTTIAWTDRYLS